MSDQDFDGIHHGFVAPAPAWRHLRIAAEIYADFQQFRIAATNRAERAGIPPEEFEGLLGGLNAQEKDLAKELHRHYRTAVPEVIRTWQKETLGLGEHTFARLLGSLGPPRQAFPWHWEGTGNGRHLVQDPPYSRLISQLWSYCGVGDATRKRKRNMTAEEGAACGSPMLRALMFIIAEGCMKTPGSPYRKVYLAARDQYADRLHKEPCVRCGPSGKPALEGSAWSAAHQHAAALRKVAKEILRDLWLVSGDEATHAAKPTVRAPAPETSQGQPSDEAQTPCAQVAIWGQKEVDTQVFHASAIQSAKPMVDAPRIAI